MKIQYHDLIDQTHGFPQEEFTLNQDNLLFNNINLMELIKAYGSPLKLNYLPKISSQINKAKKRFEKAINKLNYKGNYHYCYCTKSSHFAFVIKEALKNKIHLETSSSFDINIVKHLQADGIITKDQYIVCNGFKMPRYLQNIADLINTGHENTIPVFDNLEEAETLSPLLNKACKVGLRIASEEEPKFEFYTSRLGIRYKDIVPFYNNVLKNNPKYELKMLHFFINTGITDTAYYWNELLKSVRVYCDLKKICPSLDSINIGGGFPIKNSLSFNYDYDYMTEEIVNQIKLMCNEQGVEEPHIFTEFGSYTVGESGAFLTKIIGQKKQNDREKWNMIDSSFMTNLPDSWAINQKFILLAINNWYSEYERVLLGGLTCDSDDYYNSEAHSNAIYLPKFDKNKPQYVGFFHTGAYQESVGGYGGIQHCLIPNPKYVVVDKNEHGQLTHTLFKEEQSYDSMLKILGY